MKHLNIQLTKGEIEMLCQLYQDCQLSVLEEAELEYVLMHCDFESPVIADAKELMAISHSVKLVETKKQRKPIMVWAMRVAACVAIMLGSVAVFLHSSLNAENEYCVVYVAGEKASEKIAHEIAEADIAKMQQFMQTVNEQKAAEEAKVEQFMNHINQSK